MGIILTKLAFPREHGVVIIWAATLLFGVIFALLEQTLWLNLLIVVSYAVLFIFNYQNIRDQVEDRFNRVNLTPPLTIIPPLILLAILVPNIVFHYGLLLHILIGLLWILLFATNKSRTYIELYMGTLLLTTLFYLIATAAVGNINEIGVATVLAYWALFTGYTFTLISFVASFRLKTPVYAGFIAWVFLVIIFVVAQILHLVNLWFALLLIEPLLQSMYYIITKESYKTKGINIRKFGFRLLYSLSAFTSLFSVLLVFT